MVRFIKGAREPVEEAILHSRKEHKTAIKALSATLIDLLLKPNIMINSTNFSFLTEQRNFSEPPSLTCHHKRWSGTTEGMADRYWKRRADTVCLQLENKPQKYQILSILGF